MELDPIIVRVKCRDDMKFLSVPVNALNPSTFAFRGNFEYVFIISFHFFFITILNAMVELIF